MKREIAVFLIIIIMAALEVSLCPILVLKKTS